MNEDISDEIAKLKRTKGAKTFSASQAALDWAKQGLGPLHEGEVWILAERLDNAMNQLLKNFLQETRK